jgi:hypothetical protein
MKTYIYKGKDGQHVDGVPARDLTEQEFEALSDEQQKACIDSGLYVAQSPVAEKKAVKESTNG